MIKYQKKPIVSFENYSIDTNGIVYGVHGQVLKQQRKNGCLMVGLYKNNKTYNVYVHYLVAVTFLKPVEGCTCVGHKDGIKTNNAVYNLYWKKPNQTFLDAYHNVVNQGEFVFCESDHRTIFRDLDTYDKWFRNNF